jgi:glutamate synthase domain-containing protein 2/glutamate synthase domain-containing protein 1/glutamate synthase domain-containing protein 3
VPYSDKQYGLYDQRFEHDSCGVGFVCDVKGKRSKKIVAQGLEVLRSLAHRGATGADPKTGDGAGILIQIPDAFFRKIAKKENFSFPAAGEYGTGLIFLPTDPKERQFCKQALAKSIKKFGQVLIGWRKVPVDSTVIGVTARETEPAIEQVFIGKGKGIKEQIGLERKLYLIRKHSENLVRGSALKQKSFFYITNLSCRTFSFKGLLMPEQVEEYFVDLKDESISSAICLVHSRYSTNTFPTWDLAQPFRFLAHNGEINTLRSNINWMKAKEGLLKSLDFGKDIEELKPVIVPGGSDSAALDNAFELLTLSGRSIQHAMSMLIPAAWQQNIHLDKKVRDFFRFHSCLTEAWDGPAAIAFTDGKQIGAVLDRNGLRPARYIITKKGLVVMASEVGVLKIDPSDILRSGRLEPGKMFFIDTEHGRIIDDSEIKEKMASSKPYGAWLKANVVDIDELPKKKVKAKLPDILPLMKTFGYSREDLKILMKPMAETGAEPVGAMGDDAPHAILSKRPQILFRYFKQLFAQVTNPAIDPIREEIVMSLENFIGPEKNFLDESPLHARKLRISHPVLSNEELEKIKSINRKGFKTKVISLLFSLDNKGGLVKALDRICSEASAAIKKGYSFIVLSDRGVDPKYAALPILLAVGAVHQHLVRLSLRTQIGIIVESGEPREVHHFALLFGYGADAVNPYLAYGIVEKMADDGDLEVDRATAVQKYKKAVDKGILKILSKMGISTLQSYRGAQIFESLGLGRQVIDRCFTGTVSRIGGAGFDIIEKEVLMRHNEAFPDREGGNIILDAGGFYKWRKDGEFHLWNPHSVAALQDATRANSYEKYKEFAKLINDQSKNPSTLRSLLKFKKCRPIQLDEVESEEKILKRFVTGAMSFGSISKGAHESLAIAMNRLGGRSNTGEGGEDPARFVPLPNGDSMRSSVKQVASGRFGVTTNYLVNADEIQIKIAQGAKPGEGGQLPGHKVSEIIARTRYTTPGVTLISPPPHHDIYSIEDLAQLIFDLKNTNPKARISVKLVSEIGVGTIAAGVAKGHADMILISGADGGTGASPFSSIKHAGLPWELGISETHQTLVMNDLRSRVRLQTDGQMRTGRDVAIAAILGAEEYGFCTAALIVLGCVMLRHCNLNNCSMGVATQDDALQARFTGKPEHVENYFKFIARDLREIMAELGVRKVDDLIGRTELLEVNADIVPWKAKKIDFSKILFKPDAGPKIGVFFQHPQDHGISKVLDRKLIEKAEHAIKTGKPVKINMGISNINRTTGAMLSGEVCKVHGDLGLPEDTIHCKFDGVAGQSFGAWLAKGVTFELEGMANDYVGKGISGGKIIVYPDKKSDFTPEENIIIGNTTFYGAITGEAFIRGKAGERFCIRNSGLNTVVEGVGDHGCEYMTGGRVVVLGSTGRNFAAGMSGGIAYVYDKDGAFKDRCNMEMVSFDPLDGEDVQVIKELLTKHHKYTDSPLAKKIVDNIEPHLKRFIKVIPLEYKRVLKERAREEKSDLSGDSDG